MTLLIIDNLAARYDGKDILKGLSLSVPEGEVHAIMGPNGSGKSTLGYVLSGREGYEVTGGSAMLAGQNLFEMEIEQCVAAGLFLALQYPVEIPGVSYMNFLRTATNAVRKARGDAELEAAPFLKHIRAKAAVLGITDDMLKRPVNVGFSGGEKKRMEMLQLLLLEPKLAILDETDSGLDIDALKVVADAVNSLRAPNRSFIVITHYQRLLDYIKPDHVHVLARGKIVQSGGPELAKELEAKGYAHLAA